VFIPTTGVDVHLFQPRELIKGTSAKAAPERGNENRAVFRKTEQFSFFLFSTPFSLH
jgi:hypothetical protein